MYRFLEKYVYAYNVNSVEDVFYEVLGHCQMEIQPIEIIQDLERIGVKFPTKKELIEALNLITDFYNNTRLSANNRYTPEELLKYDKPNIKQHSQNTFI